MKTNIYSIVAAIVITVVLVFPQNLHAQNTFPSTGAAGIGTTSPNASSLLEIKSTSKGLLISRMTNTERDAIASPAIGLLIYQTNSTPGFYYYDGSGWNAVTPKAKGWSLTGNAGADSSINFVGTTDAHPLVFRVNNRRAGYIDNSTNGNTSIGCLGLLSNTYGFANKVIGSNSLKANTSGSRNTALGFFALTSKNADNNTVIGTYTLSINTNGTDNVATGLNAFQADVGGNNNAAYGTNALFSNNNGNENTSLVVFAGKTITTGSNNIFIGYNADASQNVNNSISIGSNTFTSNSNVIILGTNQNVGIGTSSPSYKPSANGTIQSKKLRVNDIPISARRNFMISFKDIQNVEWHKIKDGYFARFNQGEIATEIRYKQDGGWLCNIRTYHEDQLSPSIKNLVKSKYKDYAIVIVQEYECYKGTVWMVSLESKREQILVRVEEDEMREVYHYYKSK